MVLWVDKHRPNRIDGLDFHDDLSNRLGALAQNADSMPHLLFHGPSGAGKRTRISCLLREIYGPGASKLKVESKIFKHDTKSIEINLISSNYHIELSPGDAGNSDCFVVQDVIKEIAQTHTLGGNTQKAFKIVVLNETDQLTKNAQQALRRTMEKYVSTCRIILCCESLSKIIDPLRSRCLMIRVPSPQPEAVTQILLKISKKEGIKLPESFAMKIAHFSKGNVRKAILALEAARVQSYPFSEQQSIPTPDWEIYVDSISQMMISEQSPQRLLGIRSKFYELLTNCIPPRIIFRTLTESLLKRLDDDRLKLKVIELAADYEQKSNLGSKAIFHLEGFVAKFMVVFKAHLLELLE